MLRREADGVAWYLAKKAAEGRRLSKRTLRLWWTVLTPQATIPVVLPDIVAAIQDAMSRIDCPLTAKEFSAGLGTAGPTDLPFTDDGRAQLAAMFSSEDPGALAMRLTAPPGPNGALRAIDLSISANYSEHSVWSGQLYPAFGRDWLNEEAPRIDEEASAWSTALAGVCSAAGAAWGCAGVDFWNQTQPPYDRYFAVYNGGAANGSDEGELLADSHPRGYYWSNVLSAKHIAGLGGLAVLSARCADLDLSIETLSTRAGDELVLVRSPVPVSQFTDERLAAVRDLVEPVLRHRPYSWYAGPPLRVLKEPGTAFREISVDMDPEYRVFDDD